jgi:hypothetical protein
MIKVYIRYRYQIYTGTGTVTILIELLNLVNVKKLPVTDIPFLDKQNNVVLHMSKILCLCSYSQLFTYVSVFPLTHPVDCTLLRVDYNLNFRRVHSGAASPGCAQYHHACS